MRKRDALFHFENGAKTRMGCMSSKAAEEHEKMPGHTVTTEKTEVVKETTEIKHETFEPDHTPVVGDKHDISSPDP